MDKYNGEPQPFVNILTVFIHNNSNEAYNNVPIKILISDVAVQCTDHQDLQIFINFSYFFKFSI